MSIACLGNPTALCIYTATGMKEKERGEGICEQLVEPYIELWGQHLLLTAPRVSFELAKIRQRVQEKEMAKGEHGGAASEHEGAEGEHEGASREHGRAEGEHVDETGLSGGAKRRGVSQQRVTCYPRFGAYIYRGTVH